MREGWNLLELGKIAVISSGNSAPQKKDLFTNGTFPFIRTSDVGKIRRGFINSSADKLNEDGIKGLKLHKKGTILFPKSGASTFLNHRVMMEIDSYVSSHLATIKAIDKVTCDKYLLYFLSTIDARDLMQDIAYPSLKISDISSIPIPIPELSKQQQIVSILNDAFAAIAKAKSNAEQNLKNAKELFESYLQGMFANRGKDWKEITLDEVCVISSKLIDPRKSEFQDLIHIGAGNIESHTGAIMELKTAKDEKLISGKFLFDDTTVLYSKIRPYLKKVVKCTFRGLCSADIYPLVPIKDKVTKEFLFHVLLSKDFTEYAISGSERAGMPKVNREHLFAYKFFIPSVSEQQNIVQNLDALSLQTKKLESIYRQKINDLEELKKSILQEAFSGELTAKEVIAIE